MALKGLDDIKITDADIDWVEGLMGHDIRFDVEQRSVIKNMESNHIQACPGSGKTTVLVAKIAILANKWTYDDAGICILSHTNVAGEEIQQRLGQYEVGKKLLAHPHFIGTLQSFFDKYVAKPWLKSHGYPVDVVDTDIVTRNRWNSLDEFSIDKLMLKHRNNSICCYVSLLEEAENLNNSFIINQLKRIVNNSQKQGYFTYEEMLFYAQEAMLACNNICEAIRMRFPVVFVDEAQDNSTQQWQLIESAFGSDDKVMLQAFGDCNQAIYDKENGTLVKAFPKANHLLMANSNRFGDGIAKLANTVAFDGTVMSGKGTDFIDKETKHTIFLYSKDKINEVLKQYARLILDTFSDKELEVYKEYGCHAVGWRNNKGEESNPNILPMSIEDYWNDYDPIKSVNSKSPKNFIGYYRDANLAFGLTNELGAFFKIIYSGLIRINALVNISNRATIKGKSFAASLTVLPEGNQKKIRKRMIEVFCADCENEIQWKEIKKLIVEILKLYGMNTSKLSYDEKEKIKAILHWEEETKKVNLNEKGKPNMFIYRDISTGRSVEIAIGSIHSVKGRTHLATLVLETFTRTHNMKNILSQLASIKKTDSIKTSMGIMRLKCQYVAMTRAKALLCLALPIDSVKNNQRSALEKLGWNIEEIV